MAIHIQKLLIEGGISTGASTDTIKGTGGAIAVQALGTFVGTVELQGSLDDGATWFQMAQLTSNTPAFIDPRPVALLRGNITAYTSGTIDLVVAQNSL